MNFVDELRTQIRENKLEKGIVYDILTEEGEAFRQPDDIALRNELGRDYTNVQAIRMLKKEAQQGRRYLADVIDEAVASRVRAQGDTFNAESYRTMLRNSADIDSIKEEIQGYERMAEQRFTPGRQTEGDDPDAQKTPEGQKPDDDKQVRVDNNRLNFFEGDDK